ncbi:MAG: glycosyltransferase, partial [Proteobacteria bacterium]|nr:glycosyltransferase [Pseudomonadota bacterium]
VRDKTKMKSLRIAFLHPDLGIGGAERLVVDAVVELMNKGHEVTIFTSRYDLSHCLEKTRNSMLKIEIAGNFVPHSLAGRFRVPCAIARMILMTLAMKRASRPYDVIFCDLVPHVIPLFRLVSKARILFYCHYPDFLLAPQKNGLYRIYRIPINGLETFGMRFAHRILVNSVFTAETFQRSFPHFSGGQPEVLYPGIDIPQFLTPEDNPLTFSALTDPGCFNFLSINRYDPGKNLSLALEAMAALRGMLSNKTFQRLRLIMAGACDERLPEQRHTLNYLQAYAQQLNLQDQVVFFSSIPDNERIRLLKGCDGMIYTSTNEHFGIGIIEAMASGKPVVAVNRGGPVETILNGKTGFLCDPTPSAFARAMKDIVEDPVKAADMGTAAQKRAVKLFSMPVFGEHLENIISSLVNGGTGRV